VREYARIQTFPDAWQFVGSTSSQYKQIGNAVPVNLARAIGQSLVATLNDYYSQHPEQVRASDFSPKQRALDFHAVSA
jgi:C-5 cytosine-specific DNA methylase